MEYQKKMKIVIKEKMILNSKVEIMIIFMKINLNDLSTTKNFMKVSLFRKKKTILYLYYDMEKVNFLIMKVYMKENFFMIIEQVEEKLITTIMKNFIFSKMILSNIYMKLVKKMELFYMEYMINVSLQK